MQFSIAAQNCFKKMKLSFKNSTIFPYNLQTIKNIEKG